MPAPARAAMRRWLESVWYRPPPPPAWLAMLGGAYGAVSARVAARLKREACRLPVPVIVVGNISVGGTGKTPFVVWLVEELRARGLRPGVVSRGYGGQAPRYPLRVDRDTDPRWSGDEPALIARRLGVPLAVAPDRVAAARLLLDGGNVDVIVADDGLQHHRLARDLEICVVDGERGLGNGALLPAGPLREGALRLAGVDLIVVNGGGWRPDAGIVTPVTDMRIEMQDAVPLVGGAARPLRDFAGTRVHALAGIGYPQRFFAALRTQGLDVEAHPFPDHHFFSETDLRFSDKQPLLMTEKDAVKCAAFARPGLWWVPARAVLDGNDTVRVQQLLNRLRLPTRDHVHG